MLLFQLFTRVKKKSWNLIGYKDEFLQSVKVSTHLMYLHHFSNPAKIIYWEEKNQPVYKRNKNISEFSLIIRNWLSIINLADKIPFIWLCNHADNGNINLNHKLIQNYVRLNTSPSFWCFGSINPGINNLYIEAWLIKKETPSIMYCNSCLQYPCSIHFDICIY